MSKRALVIVDLQNEYLPTGKLPLVAIEQAIENASRVLKNARDTDTMVIHVRHEFTDTASSFFVPGTEGVQIIQAVSPQKNETVILKNYPNSFLRTNLQAVLNMHGIEQLVVVGAMSHMCIDATVRAASDSGFKVTVLHDACATRDLEFNGKTVPADQVHTAMMSALAFAYAEVISTEDYLAA
ncbi:cysteine hydrolase [Methylobacillus gramineus]|uniref:cysteine hydrolase family protein n=1 Tax=Methylobacillus gramineus TaxID=755169 RepID=UPI001CFF7C7E|nr:cysteine hydrolase family protein [Methylobacillus gramineus]MCB5185305.1 cysteine hydrolase [Methylobacillus gramineus]